MAAKETKHNAATVVLLVVVGIVVVGLGYLFYAASTPIHRGHVSRVKSDMRAMATAIEAYFHDHRAYPAWATGPASRNAGSAPSFRVEGAGLLLHTITTPIAYISSYFTDRHASEEGQTFSYYSDEGGWIMWSAGLDRDHDITGEDVAEIYDSSVEQPSPQLLTLAYDPTNGAKSSGDIFRVKQ